MEKVLFIIPFWCNCIFWTSVFKWYQY